MYVEASMYIENCRCGPGVYSYLQASHWSEFGLYMLEAKEKEKQELEEQKQQRKLERQRKALERKEKKMEKERLKEVREKEFQVKAAERTMHKKRGAHVQVDKDSQADKASGQDSDSSGSGKMLIMSFFLLRPVEFIVYLCHIISVLYLEDLLNIPLGI